MNTKSQGNNQSRFSQFISFALLSVIWFALGWVASERLDLGLLDRLTGNQNQVLGIVDRTAQLLANRQFPKNSPAEEVAYNAINGMLQFGDDPHAAFYKGLAATRYREDFLGNSGTPGLYFTIEEEEPGEKQFVLIEIVPGGPSQEAGLAVGDQILSVDGVAIDKHTSGNEVAILLRGPLDKPIDLEVLRNGEILAFTINRRAPAHITAELLDNGVGYIVQRAFTSAAAEQFKNELEGLLAQNLSGLVWDLRGNRGGSMEAAQQILSQFVADTDTVLFTVELKDGTTRAFNAEGTPLAPELPLVLLLDNRTLSASETSALTIRDHSRGTIFGTTSGGKGTIQETVPLDGNHLLHLTIGKWLSPSGSWIDGIGVVPDVEGQNDPETDEDELLQMALKYLSSN